MPYIAEEIKLTDGTVIRDATVNDALGPMGQMLYFIVNNKHDQGNVKDSVEYLLPPYNVVYIKLRKEIKPT